MLLHNPNGGSAEIRVTNVYSPTLIALGGGEWVSNFQKKRYITLEWPLMLVSEL